MSFLKDTCVFIDSINTNEEIIKVARHCKAISKEFCLTDYVLNEIKPGERIKINQPLSAQISEGIVKGLSFCEDSKIVKIIRIEENKEYKKNFNDIRNRYYGHLKDHKDLQRLISEGKITLEQVKSPNFRYKDFGECSCIAVAMCNPEKYTIVTNDKGRIFLKKDINLFDIYKEENDIQVCNYSEWCEDTGYTKIEELNMEDIEKPN